MLAHFRSMAPDALDGIVGMRNGERKQQTEEHQQNGELKDW